MTSTVATSGGTDTGVSRAARPRRRQWWVVLFAAYCLAFSIYGGYRYLTLNPELSRVPIREDFPVHYPLLTAHVITGMIAISVGWAQVWPWLRTHHPVTHRRLGRIYFFAGVFPSAITAFPVAILTPAGQGIRAVLLVMSAIWLFTAIAGLRAILQRRTRDHERWMLRNVAMSTTVITSRILSSIFIEATLWLLPETYGHQQRLVFEEMSATGLWVAIALHLGFVEWYLLRPRRGRATSRPRTGTAPSRS